VLKGRLENMMLGYGDYKDHDKYLPLAYDSAQDIEKLVKEIILITKTENVDISSRLCEVSLVQTIDDTVQDIMPLADEKGICIHQQVARDITLTVDKELWCKAISNIIGNAVFHSPSGAQVFIELEEQNGKDALAVTNTDTAVPKEDIEHLFAPFYRADKSRNRATGGSGLGLYIVRNILDMHGMSCDIKNTQRGVCFTLLLPGAANKSDT
jgi:two-component system sensor histidine kinase VanS